MNVINELSHKRDLAIINSIKEKLSNFVSNPYLDSLAQTHFELNQKGVNTELIRQYLLKYGKGKSSYELPNILDSISSNIDKFGSVSVSKAIEKGIPLFEIPEYCYYQRSLENREQLRYIDLLVHAQRKEHYLLILHQIEQAGGINNSYSLKTKEENNMLGNLVPSYSPNGRGEALAPGLNTISTNNSRIQNGYGSYVWIMPPATILARPGYSFSTMLDTSRGLIGNIGEIGISTPASELIDNEFSSDSETWPNRTLRPALLGNAKANVESQNKQVGIPLNRPEVFCLVPLEDYEELVARIDNMLIPADQKIFLKNQLIPHGVDDLLGNEMLETLKNNPATYLKLIRRNAGTLTMPELALMQQQLQAQNFRDRKGKLGTEYLQIPILDKYGTEAIVQDMALWESRQDLLGMTEILRNFEQDTKVFFFKHLNFLIKTYRDNRGRENDPDYETTCREIIKNYCHTLSKKTRELTQEEISLLDNAAIDLTLINDEQRIIDFFRIKYFPGLKS